MNAVSLYRISSWFYNHHLEMLAKLFRGIIFFLHNSYIPYTCKIGKNTVCAYKGIGVVIHARAVIGDYCLIGQGITIGGRSKHYEVPVIGNNVILGQGPEFWVH
jgi:serine O-acetyltransferase